MPFGQGVHLVDPSLAMYVPAAQGVHAFAPSPAATKASVACSEAVHALNRAAAYQLVVVG